jgi:hypothetical protein
MRCIQKGDRYNRKFRFETCALANLFMRAVKWDPQESYFHSLALELKCLGVDEILDEIKKIYENATRTGFP